MNFDYPLLLKPIAVPRPWGGGRLCKLYDRECVSANEPIGESWDVSAWPKDPGNPDLATVTTIINGRLAGKGLDEVIDAPVVVKLLDSAEKLSVQVHPVEEDAHKDEMWYILHADPDAYLFWGLAQGVDKKAFCDKIHDPNASEAEVLEMLNRVDNLKPGDLFNVPTGTVHAVGPGIVAFEVSEKTQVTYRLYDYNRGRALHLEQGCEATLKQRPDWPVLDYEVNLHGADGMEVLTEFPTFAVIKGIGNKFTVEAPSHAHLVTATFGDIRFSGRNADWDVELKKSCTALVPSDAVYKIDTQGSGEVLITMLK